MNIVEKQIDKVKQLCKKYKVKTLYLFGSVLTDRFSDKSDVDMVVEFQKMPLKVYANNYFDLKFALQEIFNRDVDLLENQAIRNPYLKKLLTEQKNSFMVDEIKTYLYDILNAINEIDSFFLTV